MFCLIKMSYVTAQQANHAPQQHDEDEIFYILYGQAEFTLADEKMLVDTNTALYCPANVLHGIRNNGYQELKYLVIKNN